MKYTFLSLVVSCLFFLISVTIAQPILRITEVFFDTDDEWIEISNLGTGDYVGPLTISGAKTNQTDLILGSVSIPSLSQLVIANNQTQFVDLSGLSLLTGVGLRMDDNSSIDLSLVTLSGVVDTFFVATGTAGTYGTVKNFNDKRQSFALTPVVSGFVLSGVAFGSQYNTYAGYVGHPGWFSPFFGDIPPSGDREALVNNTTDIYISELYFDGGNEWIELVNIGYTDFLGTITIIGAGEFPQEYTLSLPAGQVLVLADNPVNYIAFTTGATLQKPANFSLLDKNPLINLLIGGVVQDVFVRDYDQIDNISPKTSFQKKRQGTGLALLTTETTPLEQINVTDLSIIGHPGVVYDLTGNIVFPRSILTVPLTCSQSFLIDEVFRGSGNMSAFIEILSLSGKNYALTLSGTALTSPVLLTPSIAQNERLLVSQSSLGLVHSGQIVVDNTLLLQSGILEIREGSILLDAVQIVVGENQAFNTGLCGRAGQSIAYPTPGFDDQFLVYLPVQTITNTITVGGGGGGGGGGTTIVYQCTGDVTGTGSDTGTGNDGGGDGILTGIVLSGGIMPGLEITYINYNPDGSDTNNEQIEISRRSSFSGLSSGMILSGNSLSLENRYVLIESRRIFLEGLVSPGGSLLITDNFRMVNSRPVCVQLWRNGPTPVSVDEMCYDPDDSGNTGTGDDAQDDGDGGDETPPTTGTVADQRPVIIKIRNIIYDPDGSDTDREIVSLELLSGADSVDLSDGYKLRIGTRNATINGILSTGSVQNFVGNYRLPNTKDTCVSLMREDLVYDIYCYEIPTDDPDDGETDGDDDPFDPTLYDVTIDNIVYDPPGSNTNNEKITLTLVRGPTLDLAKLRLVINTRTTRFDDGLTLQGTQTYTDNFRFPNSGKTCVLLMYEEYEFDTLCYDPDENKDDEEESIDILYTGLNISIDSILYDPEGSDTDREELSLTIDYTTGINLADDFRLRIGTAERSLSSWGVVGPGKEKLTGNFRFPNTKATCVQIFRKDNIYDEYCYDPGKSEDDETPHPDPLLGGEGDVLTGNLSLVLTRLLPNPVGADGDREGVGIMLLSGSESVSLSDGYKLRIGTRTVGLSGTAFLGQEFVVYDKFGLTNKAICVELIFSGSRTRSGSADVVLDILCYPKPEEGIRYTDNGAVSILDERDRLLLSQISLTGQGDKRCMVYGSYIIDCRSKKIQILKDQDLELLVYKEYVRRLEDVLTNDRYLLWKNTDLFVYSQLFRTNRDLAKDNIPTRFFLGREYPLYDFETQKRVEYGRNSSEKLQDTIFTTLFDEETQRLLVERKDQYLRESLEEL